MRKLYEINGDGMELLSLLENEEADEDVILDTMEGWEGEYNSKIEIYLKIIKQLEAEAAAYKPEIDRMTANKKALENRAAWLKSQVFQSMQTLGYKEAGGETIKAKIQKNGGKAPLIFDVDEASVPMEYQVVTHSVDKDLVRSLLEEGNTLDFAHLGERGESLRIK